MPRRGFMFDRITPQKLFKAAQSPTMWLSLAHGLAQAGEAILREQESAARAYEDAVKAAGERLERTGEKRTEIEAEAPNYRSAHLLYAFALENALKGLVVAKDPSLTTRLKLAPVLKSHRLNELAARAGIATSAEEESTLTSLTHIAEWAGRYPVALDMNQQGAFAYWGELPAFHAVARGLYKRIISEAELIVGRQSNRGVLVIVD